MLAAVRLSVATVAVVQDYAERLRYANETITLSRCISTSKASWA